MQKKSDDNAPFLSVEDVKNVLTVSLKQEIYTDTSLQTSAGFLQTSPAMDLAQWGQWAPLLRCSIQLALHSALKALWRNILTVCWKSQPRQKTMIAPNNKVSTSTTYIKIFLQSQIYIVLHYIKLFTLNSKINGIYMLQQKLDLRKISTANSPTQDIFLAVRF